MAKTLKKWNGRCRLRAEPRQGSAYIAAYSQKQAAELLAKAEGHNRVSVSDIRTYFSQCWGNPMDGIDPIEPCLYYKIGYGPEPPKRIL